MSTATWIVGQIVRAPSVQRYIAAEVDAAEFQIRTGLGIEAAAVAIYFSSATIENAVFFDNLGDAMAGGLLAQGGNVSLLQASFAGNDSEYGGGGLAALSDTKVTVRNVVFADGTATWAPDLGGAIQRCTTKDLGCPATVEVAFTDAWQNTPVQYGNMPDPTGQSGNISVPPMFVNQAGGDLHLAPGSPLIDVGDPQILDKDATPSDIGAYGGPGA